MASAETVHLVLTDIVDFLFVGVGLALAVGLLVKGLVYLRRGVQILSGDTLPIATLTSAIGPVEIAGTARVADEVVRAPFSDVECLACEYEITKWSGGTSESGGGHETTLYEGRVQTRFYVEDDTASVLVDPAGAMLNFEEHETRVSKKRDVPESLRGFLDEHPEYDLDASRWNRSTQTFTERRLEPGEQVHVYGVARYDPTASKRAGTINAIIDAPPTSGPSLSARVRGWISIPPFVISDARERTAVRRLLTAAGFYLGVVAVMGLFVVFEF